MIDIIYIEEKLIDLL